MDVTVYFYTVRYYPLLLLKSIKLNSTNTNSKNWVLLPNAS